MKLRRAKTTDKLFEELGRRVVIEKVDVNRIAELEAELAKYVECTEHYGPSLPCGGALCYHKKDEGDPQTPPQREPANQPTDVPWERRW